MVKKITKVYVSWEGLKLPDILDSLLEGFEQIGAEATRREEYQCGLCGREYETQKRAQECEAQGIIGPEIKPGLILEGRVERKAHYIGVYWDIRYMLFLGEEKFKHYRRYIYTKIDRSLSGEFKFDYEWEYGSWISVGRIRWPKYVAKEEKIYGIDKLASQLREGDIKFLDEEEFTELRDLIKNDSYFDHYQTALKEHGVKNLYRKHKYLEDLVRKEEEKTCSVS